jgi:PAS domain S-box-containing protein
LNQFEIPPKGTGQHTEFLPASPEGNGRHDESLRARQTEEKLRESQDRLAVELAAAERLHAISTRLIQEGDTDQLYERILDAALSIMKSDMASMQIVDEKENALRLLTWRGFDAAFGETFRLNRPDTRTSCSIARRTAQRVIVPDVETCDFIVHTPALEDHRKTGIRAVQSTPLVSREGRVLGMISTHWRNPHQPGEGDLRLLDMLARQAADLIERKESERILRESEERFRAVMNNVADGLYTVDTKGLVTYVNPAAERMFGWTSVELLGRKMHDVTHYKHPDGACFAAEDCPGLKVLQLGIELREHEDVFIRKNGSFFPVVFSASPLREGSETVGIVVAFRDDTERRNAEQALRQSEERYRTLFNLGPVAVYSIDTSGVIRNFNRRAAELWGREPALGDTDERFCGSYKLFRPDGSFMPHHECPMAEVVSGKISAANDAEVLIERPDGSRITVIVNIRPLKNDREEITGAINCFYDISQRKQVEEALREAQDQLQTQNDKLELTVEQRTAKLRDTIHELESYSYSISHDMRAPLRAMQAYAQVLIDELGSQLDERHRRYLDRITAASNRLDKLITDVLSYTRLARGEIDLKPVNLDRLVEDITYQYPALQNAEIEIAPDLGTVIAAEALLTQAIANLLTNAAKFVAPGVKPRIRIWSEQSANSSVKLMIRDNGIGIAPQDQDRIFAIFARVHSQKEYEGTGIGLSIVKKAIERMNGQFGLTSEPGQGSTFWLELPKA